MAELLERAMTREAWIESGLGNPSEPSQQDAAGALLAASRELASLATTKPIEYWTSLARD
jgi:hypothetical protein